jgi:hypothetical protein
VGVFARGQAGRARVVCAQLMAPMRLAAS